MVAEVIRDVISTPDSIPKTSTVHKRIDVLSCRQKVDRDKFICHKHNTILKMENYVSPEPTYFAAIRLQLHNCNPDL